MALVHYEGFDDGLHALRADISGTEGSSWAIFSGGRFGDKCLRCSSTTYGVSFTANAHATVTIGFAFKAIANNGSSTFLVFRGDNGATSHIQCYHLADDSLDIRRGGSAVLLNIPGFFPTSPEWMFVEMTVTINDTTGAITVWKNNVQVGAVSGVDTKNGGTNISFDRVTWEDYNVSGTDYDLDDVYVVTGGGASPTSRLGDCRVVTLLPGGNGNYSQLTGSDSDSTDNYLLVDESAPTLGVTGGSEPGGFDYVGSSSAQKDTYAFGDTGVSAGTVHALRVAKYAGKSDTGDISCRDAIRISGSDYTGSTRGMSNSYGLLEDQYLVSPDTASAWGLSEIDGAEFGFEVVP